MAGPADNLIAAGRRLSQSTLPVRIADVGEKLGGFLQHPIDGVAQMLGMVPTPQAQPEAAPQMNWTPQANDEQQQEINAQQVAPKPTLRMKMPKGK
jgi:hypothetical protein